MRISNKMLSKSATIKAEVSGRVFFNVGPHMLSYFYFNNQHIVAFVGKFWKSGVLDSVGAKQVFSNDFDALDFIKTKSEYLNSKSV